MTQVITFANQKGGVGKTTLAVHMAILAHSLGLKTLLVDLDQQGSATFLVSGNGDLHKTLEGTALDLWDDTKRVPLQESAIFGFDFLQSSFGLDQVDQDIHRAVDVLGKLRRVDSGQGLYDVVVIDCPPAPNVRQLAPMMVANTQVIPITPDALGTQGLASMVDLCLEDVAEINPEMSVRVLINRLKANSPKNRAIAQEVQEGLPDITVPQILYEREDVRSALRAGKPYWAVCRDAEQRNAWYRVFYDLLQVKPENAGTEIEEPEGVDVDAILAKQEERRGYCEELPRDDNPSTSAEAEIAEETRATAPVVEDSGSEEPQTSEAGDGDPLDALEKETSAAQPAGEINPDDFDDKGIL